MDKNITKNLNGNIPLIDPCWDKSEIKQEIGRAIRSDRHDKLLKNECLVETIIYKSNSQTKNEQNKN